MSKITDLTLEQTEEKMATRQDELKAIMDEAKVGTNEFDWKQAKSLGVEVKNASDFRDAIQKRNAELDELGKHAQSLRDINDIAGQVKAREETPRGFVHPQGGGGQGGLPANRGQFKSLGEQLIEAKAFKDWIDGARGAALEMKFEKALASEFLARGAHYDTMQAKALMSTTSGFAPESIRMPGFVEAVTRPIQLVDILPMGRTNQPAITYMEETTRTHAAAETAEGAAFAESTFAFTERTSPVRKITDSVPVTDEQMEDVPLIEGYINNRLPFGIRQRLDEQVGVGDGTGTNLRGLFNTPGILTLARVAGDNVVDVFYKGAVQVRLQGRAMATHHVIHPLDFQDVRLMKTADGVYIYGDPSVAGPERMWGLPVVQYEPQGAGRAMTGSFMPSYIELIERRGIDIQVGYVDAQFTQGQKTIRGDMRGALPVYRPAAFNDLDLTAP